MPLPDEDWNETEIELDKALCNFCNNADDPIADVNLWSASVRRDFVDLCKAYNEWYSWRKDKSEQIGTD
jgi:hypothetical protein